MTGVYGRLFVMNNFTHEYRISPWLAEFSDGKTETAFQEHRRSLTHRRIRAALVVWSGLMLVFALSDYSALGETRDFFCLLTYRLVIASVLIIIVLRIRPETDLMKISYAVTLVFVVGLSGFMMLFFYRPDAFIWTVGAILIQITALLIFMPIRFILACIGSFYGVLLTLATCRLMGHSATSLGGLCLLLGLQVALCITIAFRQKFSERQAFALLANAETVKKKLADEIGRRRHLELKLREAAEKDPLTGLMNRREYERLAGHEIERARRMNAPLCLCIADLDHFRQVNDVYGHGIGDDILRRTADILRKSLRSMDIIGCPGGAEFILMLPGTTVEQAVAIGKRLLNKLSTTDIDTGSSTIRMTATMGISQLLSGERDINAIMQRADAALYRGEQAGRNRVEVSLI